MEGKAAKKSTRMRLLEAARVEIVIGNGDLDVANVAKRAGVSDGLTYYHFGNKAGLINAIVNEFYHDFDDKVAGVPFDGDTWKEREKARVHAMVSLFYDDPVAMIAATRLRTDPAFTKEEWQRNDRLEQLGARNIADAQRKGEIDETYNPLMLASMLLSGVMSGVRIALTTKPPLPVATAQQSVWGFVERAAGIKDIDL
ncbi:transcriptional regulator, TetR family [Paraglaciecola sp. T6c]|uniref:TetR/AcrR family transcriptional regulator n=1 Tax=Pseudoalteromonas atlantica (strain T6c / ATCC BAA-1087) TaxID=3042615 RepID=UPI00005C52F8|nr:TetR/AcrR family transcriptional regulator [Paraglaciecola sp. T6c]ABG42271.1 transcriptional regulator, TetR family [Paraglaciecola sp. T6c]